MSNDAFANAARAAAERKFPNLAERLAVERVVATGAFRMGAEWARGHLSDRAADIWDQGYEAGELNGYAIGRDIDIDEDTTNPYRIEHT